MKKRLLLLTIFTLVFTSCEPLDDINTAIDADDNAIVGDVTYTLTDEDYDALELSYGSFSSLDDAKAGLPGFLSEKYPVWGKGSSALIGFKLYVGNAPGVSDYTGSGSYTLANSDYPAAADNAVGFYEDQTPADYMASILANGIENPTEGQVVLAKYKQYVGETVNGISNYFEADFSDQTLAGFQSVSVTGDDQVWFGSSYGAQMTGYDSGTRYANVDYLISPEIDLTSQSNARFQINQAINFASGRLDLINILVSADYDGTDPAAATWTTIDLETAPDGTSWSFVLSEEYDFSAFEGEKVYIAFKYESLGDPDNIASTWEILDVKIKVPGVEGVTENKEAFYVYIDGSWELSEGVYFLSDADFDSMGQASGQPGQYNNFSSSISPNDYLPTFLGNKFPYAQEGDELLVIYDYYSSSTGAQLRGNLYTVVDGSWFGYESTIDTTLQLAHDGTTWVPDNTIKYELVAADYALIADTYRAEAGYESAVANLETYGNISTFNWTSDQINAAVNTVLMNNFPGMEEDQKFNVTIYVYDGSSHNVVFNYILNGGVYVLN